MWRIPMRHRYRILLAGLAFVLLALGLTWPLPLHLSTRLTGSPTGDTGVYVWNIWVFRHELLRHLQWPFTTDFIFALTRGTEMSVHNYTVFADVLALPLIGPFGVVAAFNLVYIALVAMSGHAAFLLVRRLTGRTLEAWIAGAAFAASPFLIARGTAHFSLVAAAPLPLFLLCLLKALEKGRRRDAILVGLVAGWAGYCDVYYTIFCALMGIAVAAHHQVSVVWTVPNLARWRVRIVNGLLGASACVLAWRLSHANTSINLLGQVITIRTLYTPVLLVTALALIRLAFSRPFRLAAQPHAYPFAAGARLSAWAMATTAIVLSPVIVGLAGRFMSGRLPRTPIYWRSSPPGVDLLELVLPNPNHPWFGGPGMRWILQGGPLAYPEFAGSLSLVALGLIAFSIWRMRPAMPRFWIAFTAAFALLALGPFVHIAGVNTYVPGPWSLLRYVPVVGLARAPSRFAVVAALGVSVLLGYALTAMRSRWPGRWQAGLPVVIAMLAFELLPAPRPLYDATAPSVYSLIRQNPDESTRLLELPGGVRDGTSSIGDFNASAQFYQTVHRKPLLGGYQSRVSEWRKTQEMKSPVTAALYQLSEGDTIPTELATKAVAAGPEFIDEACLGYVVVDRRRASRALRTLAIDALDLVKVADDVDRELFTPRRPRTRRFCGGTTATVEAHSR
jgi:hypothetical protein